jgi:hypothetical protein
VFPIRQSEGETVWPFPRANDRDRLRQTFAARALDFQVCEYSSRGYWSRTQGRDPRELLGGRFLTGKVGYVRGDRGSGDGGATQ